MARLRELLPRTIAPREREDRSDSDAGRIDHEHDVVPRRVPEPDYVQRHTAYVHGDPTDSEPLVDVHLRLTPYEAGLLTAAVCEQFHQFKAVLNDETYGALIGDERVLAARRVWLMVEDQTHVGEWTNPEPDAKIA